MSLFESDPIFGSAQLWALPSSSVETTTDCFSLGSLKTLEAVEPVGRTYHFTVYPPESTQNEQDEALALQIEANTKLRNKIKEADVEDYYALLDLSDKLFDATIEDIQAAYKRIHHLLHPDKATTADRADAEVRFMAMQKGYDILVDPKTRVAYDSAREFDEAIPGPKDGLDSAEDFFAAYTDVFIRNAPFSSVKPVPQLGDMTSAWADVNAFYSFWYSFKSWREFSHMDTERVGDSASRNERRWAEQKNKKARETLKAAEVSRVRKLVDRAYAADPRVKAEKARIAEQKKSTKVLTPAEKKKAEAEAKKIAEEEAKKKAEEDAILAKAATADKKRRQKEAYEMKKVFKAELEAAAVDAALMEKMLVGFAYELGMSIQEARDANPGESILNLQPVKDLMAARQ